MRTVNRIMTKNLIKMKFLSGLTTAVYPDKEKRSSALRANYALMHKLGLMKLSFHACYQKLFLQKNHAVLGSSLLVVDTRDDVCSSFT